MGMVMRHLTAAQVHAEMIRELGLDPEALDLNSPEGLACALRRAANYVCPCSEATLLRAVVGPLRGLVSDLDAIRYLAEETLEALVAHGDVLEQPEITGADPSARVLLYAAPASFVVRKSGVVLLLGTCTDHLSPLPAELERRIEHLGHVRKLRPISDTEDLRTELHHAGLIEQTSTTWLKSPKRCTSMHALAAHDQALDAMAPSRDIPGLMLLDPTKPVTYYKGRWTEPTTQSGRYVARRRQAYGANLWCYVQLAQGQPERMIDFPARGNRWRGCDEAWHLQMAIDATRGVRQRYRVTASGDTVLLELFSPVPAWARRRWDAIGEPVVVRGSLFAYRIPRAEIEEERQFAREGLWMEEQATRS
jgi:hypothetical protein